VQVRPERLLNLYDHSAELAVIGAIAGESQLDIGAGLALLDRLCLTSSDFHLLAHRDLFVSVEKLIRGHQTAEAVGAWAALRTSKPVQAAGGWAWVFASLRSPPGSSGAVVSYATTIRDLAVRRSALLLIEESVARLSDLQSSSADVVASTERALRALMVGSPSAQPLSQYLPQMVDEMTAAGSGREALVPTGIHLLDEQIGGLQPTLMVVGALAGVGKSALLATIIANVSSRAKVGVFSLEDERGWICWRLLARHSGMQQHYLRAGRLNEYQQGRVNDAFTRLEELAPNIIVDDRSALSPQEIVRGARDMVVNRGAQVIVVDHLGEMRYPNGRKERYDLDVADGLSDLRTIAKQYGVPVLCASHLNRAADGGEIRLSSFANSAAIERQARVALGLQRKPGADELIVTVLKQTNGPAGAKIALEFDGPSAMVKSTGGRLLEDDAQKQGEQRKDLRSWT